MRQSLTRILDTLQRKGPLANTRCIRALSLTQTFVRAITSLPREHIIVVILYVRCLLSSIFVVLRRSM